VSGKSFEGQVSRMGWEPGARPRPELVDRILDHHGHDAGRDIGPSLLGVALGALLGLLLKGMGLDGSPWGAGTGFFGDLIGALALGGFAAAVLAAVLGAMRAKSNPELLQFASINLLTVLIVYLV